MARISRAEALRARVAKAQARATARAAPARAVLAKAASVSTTIKAAPVSTPAKAVSPLAVTSRSGGLSTGTRRAGRGARFERMTLAEGQTWMKKASPGASMQEIDVTLMKHGGRYYRDALRARRQRGEAQLAKMRRRRSSRW